MSSSETLLPAALTGTKRHYRVALSNSNERGREVVLKSFLTLGELYELIGVEDVVTGDDAYIQPIREEICGRGVYQGQYAQRLGLVHIASRRVNEQSNDLLYRHTGAKRTYNGYVLDGNGNRMYYPRQYIVRMVSDEERALDKEKKVTNRKKVLNTLAKILMEANQATSAPQPPSRSLVIAGSMTGDTAQQRTPLTGVSTGEHHPPLRVFAPISYCVPAQGWDMTPCELKPLSWYLTDNQVANIIYAVYREVDFGGWKKFANNVAEAHVYFHPPYGYAARALGYTNQDEVSTSLAEVELRNGESVPVEQHFDADDIMQL